VLAKWIPVSTPVGTLHGRDALYVDTVAQERDVLVFQGEINGELCRPKPSDRVWVGFRIRFRALVELHCIALDDSPYQSVSSFDVEEAASSKCGGIRFLLSSYDYVYLVYASADYQFEELGRRYR